MIDCDTNNNGCRGGNPKTALKFLKDTTGMWYEGEYRYKARSQRC